MNSAARRSVSSRESGARSVSLSARSRLERICARNPTSILFARLADVCLRDGDVEFALTACRRGLRYRPSYATGHLVMAACHRVLGQLEAARDEYRKVLQLDPDNVAALMGLFGVEPELGRPEVAARCRDRAAALDPFHPDLRIKSDPQEIAADRGEEIDDAPSGDTTSIDEAPAGPRAGRMNGFGVTAENIEAEPGDAIQRSVKVGSAGAGFDSEAPPFATVTLARLYAEQGHIERARKILAEVIDREPGNDRAIALKKEFDSR